jgi:hypothetical protein
MSKKPLVVNFFGGPGAGKSTQAAILFAKLKMEGFNAEYVQEYAKDQTWQEGWRVLSNQIYVFGKQHQRMWRLQDKVDVIVTDSPIVMGLAYSQGLSDTFFKLVHEEFSKFDNFNVWLNRGETYQQVGRTQDIAQAIQKDAEIRAIMTAGDHKFDIEVDTNEDTCQTVLSTLLPYIASR